MKFFGHEPCSTPTPSKQLTKAKWNERYTETFLIRIFNQIFEHLPAPHTQTWFHNKLRQSTPITRNAVGNERVVAIITALPICFRLYFVWFFCGSLRLSLLSMLKLTAKIYAPNISLLEWLKPISKSNRNMTRLTTLWNKHSNRFMCIHFVPFRRLIKSSKKDELPNMQNNTFWHYENNKRIEKITLAIYQP